MSLSFFRLDKRLIPVFIAVSVYVLFAAVDAQLISAQATGSRWQSFLYFFLVAAISLCYLLIGSFVWLHARERRVAAWLPI